MENKEKTVEAHSRSRPSSYYDNMNENKHPSNNNMKEMKECKFSESLTQMHCLNTTVPQNIGRQDFGGKHTPTRSSLRHSRMIVLNRSGQVTSRNTPLFLKYHKVVKAILLLTVLIGFSLCAAFLWLHIWSPNLKSSDYFWSILPVLVSGVTGIIFINMCPKLYNRDVNIFIRSVKYVSIAVTALAATASLIVFIFSLIYIVTLLSMECTAFDNHDTTCLCRSSDADSATSYHFVDLTCEELGNILTSIILYTCVANLLLTLLKLVYLYLHWASRNVYIYTRVSGIDNTSIIYKPNR